MKLTAETPQSEVIGESYDQSITISKESSYFIIKSLIDLYSDPIGSIVREIGSNMVDAHREKFKILEGKIPTPKGYDPKYFETSKSKLPRIDINGENVLSGTSAEISFTDYGLGISPDRMRKIFTTMGQSTKRDTNEMIGAFGLGSKSPWTYTDAFYLTTVVSEVKYYYTLVFLTGSAPQIKLLSKEKCVGEKNSVIITIPILKKGDTTKFLDSICKQLYFFTNIEVYNNTSESTVIDKNSNNKLHMFLDTLLEENSNGKEEVVTNKLVKTESLIAVNNHSAIFKKTSFKILVGKVIYSINTEIEEISKVIGNSGFLSNSPIALRAKIGEVDLTPSRESLRYTEKTISTIQLLINKANEEVESIISSFLDKISKDVYDIYYAPTYVEHINKKEQTLSKPIHSTSAINFIKTFFFIEVDYREIITYLPWNKMGEFFKNDFEELQYNFIINGNDKKKLLKIFSILNKFLVSTHNIQDKNLGIISALVENISNFYYNKPKNYPIISLNFFYKTSGNYLLRSYRTEYTHIAVSNLNLKVPEKVTVKQAKKLFNEYLNFIRKKIKLKNSFDDLFSREADKNLETVIIPKNPEKVASPLKNSFITEILAQDKLKMCAGFYEDEDDGQTIIDKISNFITISESTLPTKFLYKTKGTKEMQYQFFNYCEDKNVLGDFYKYIKDDIFSGECEYLEDFYKTVPVLNNIIKSYSLGPQSYDSLLYPRISFYIRDNYSTLFDIFNSGELINGCKIKLDINNISKTSTKQYYFTSSQTPVAIFIGLIETILKHGEFLKHGFTTASETYFYKVSEEFSSSLELEQNIIKNVFDYFKDTETNNSLRKLSTIHAILNECFQGDFDTVFPTLERFTVPKDSVVNIFNGASFENSFESYFKMIYQVLEKMTEIAITSEDGLKSVKTFFEEYNEFLEIAGVSPFDLVDRNTVDIFTTLTTQEMPQILKDFLKEDSHTISFLKIPIILNNLKDLDKITEYYDSFKKLANNLENYLLT